MRPIIPFITIQAIYLSALMRVLFRFASSTEQGIKLTKEKKGKKEKCGLCALITDNVLLANIYLSLYILLEFWRFGDKLHNYFTFAIIISFSPSIY